MRSILEASRVLYLSQGDVMWRQGNQVPQPDALESDVDGLGLRERSRAMKVHVFSRVMVILAILYGGLLLG